MSIVSEYMDGLLKRLPADEQQDMALITGAPPAEIARLKAVWPACPAELIELLARVNGTYYQEYGSHRVSVLMLGADVDMGEYPYYLLSVEQILAEREYNESLYQRYGDDLEWLTLDERIDPKVPLSDRLCFSHCMNNGGTSLLYVDFHPAAGGVAGQIIRFVHDPDEYKVIADDFASYLRQLIAHDYPFIEPDE